MSIHITHGPIKITVQQDAEGFSLSCPLCHNLFFSTGDIECCRKLVQGHMSQFHKIILPDAIVTEDDEEPPKVQLQYPV